MAAPLGRHRRSRLFSCSRRPTLRSRPCRSRRTRSSRSSHRQRSHPILLPRRNSISSYFAQQNTGKDNISLDLSKPEATDIILGLVEHADVVIENFRPGVMKDSALTTSGSPPSDLNSSMRHRMVTAPAQVGKASCLCPGHRRRDWAHQISGRRTRRPILQRPPFSRRCLHRPRTHRCRAGCVEPSTYDRSWPAG